MSPVLRARAAAAAGTLLAGLTACATVPAAQAPRVALSAQSTGLSGAAAPPAPEHWWRDLNDPQLDALIDSALRDNPGLDQARSRLHLAQSQIEQAAAGRRPSVTLSGSELRSKIPATFPQILGGGHSWWVGDLGAAVSWDLDLFGRQADSAAQARALAQAADLDLAQAQLLLTGALTQAYIDLYRADALADIARTAETQRRTVLTITQQRVAAGLDTRLELRAAESAVPQARVALLQAQAAQAQAVHALAALTGRGADAYEQITPPRLDLDAALPLPAQLPMNLLARRPDVIAAHARIEAADAQRRAAKAAFYPSVNLRALAGFASFSLSDLLGASGAGYGAGPAFSLPLFDGGRLRAQFHGAQAGLEAAVASYNDTVVRAVRQAADQLSDIDALTRELEQQGQSLGAAEDAYRLAEERYRAGLASYLSVLSAETEVLDNRRQRVDFSAALAMARITLLLAVGGSFQPEASPTVAAR
jgi:NodT family efflux transporter outer membrane factor (OMF) lipoprotein